MKWYRWLAFDAAFLAMATAVVGLPLMGVALLTIHLPGPTWLKWALGPVEALVFLFGMAGTTWLVRLLLPRLEPGSYAYPAHPQCRAWLLHFALRRIAALQLWAPVIFSFASLRFVMLRALGARVAFDMQTSVDARVIDCPLVEVGEGSMLAAETLVVGHFLENDQLMLAKVQIARGVQVMGGATLAPGVCLGENVVVGPGSKLLPHVQVGEDSYVGMACLLYNGVRVGANAVIGHEVTCEADVVIGDGAVVQSGARVPRGTVIGDGEHYPPRIKAGVA